MLENGAERPETIIAARITRPDMAQENVLLSYQGSGIWEMSYQLPQGGRYIVDVRATPPADSGYSSGYDSAVAQVLSSRSPITVVVESLDTPFARGELAPLECACRPMAYRLIGLMCLLK